MLKASFPSTASVGNHHGKPYIEQGLSSGDSPHRHAGTTVVLDLAGILLPIQAAEHIVHGLADFRVIGQGLTKKTLYLSESLTTILIDGQAPFASKTIPSVVDEICGRINQCVEETIANDRNNLSVQEVTSWQGRRWF